MLAQKGQTTNCTWYELQFLKGVNLFVLWFADNGSVAVDEQYLFHCLMGFQCYYVPIRELR